MNSVERVVRLLPFRISFDKILVKYTRRIYAMRAWRREEKNNKHRAGDETPYFSSFYVSLLILI